MYLCVRGIEVPVPSQESKQSCIYVLEVLKLPLSMIFLLNIGTVLTVWYFFFSLLSKLTV
jgi:hypothetical protein